MRKGIDTLDQNEDIVISSNQDIQNLWVFIKKVAVGLAERITPLGNLTKKIEIQQDKSVASLFVNFRFLIGLSMFNLLGFVFLFIR